MPKTLAIFGAGPVLGLAVARRFGREGFRVALVSRTKENQDKLVAELANDGIEAAGFSADVSDRTQIAGAVEAITKEYGQIDAVIFSPGGGSMGEGIVPALDITPEALQAIFDEFVLTGVALVNAALPAMVERGDGAIIFTAGQSGVYPTPMLGNAGMGQAALRNYFYNLNGLLADKGVYVGAVNIGALIEGSVPFKMITSRPNIGFEIEAYAPAEFAENYWELYSKREKPEALVGSMGQ